MTQTGRHIRTRYLLITRSLYANIARKELMAFRVITVDIQGTFVARWAGIAQSV